MDPEADIEIPLLLEAIHRRYHYDFRRYSMASLRRRLSVALERLGCESVSQLQHRVLREPPVFAALLEDLTVPVTELFRDPAYFRALREHVVPLLRTYPSLKIWVAGCSTGEEVYSILILLEEEGLLARTILYATDINAESLRRAEAGVYPIERIRRYTANYQRAGGRRSLADYYTAAYDRVIFDRRLRSAVVFSDHSLATDHVFAEVQLVSCRNVLIYFDAELQGRALRLFAESLSNRAFLGLGSHESLRASPEAVLFEPLVERARLYRKRP